VRNEGDKEFKTELVKKWKILRISLTQPWEETIIGLSSLQIYSFENMGKVKLEDSVSLEMAEDNRIKLIRETLAIANSSSSDEDDIHIGTVQEHVNSRTHKKLSLPVSGKKNRIKYEEDESTQEMVIEIPASHSNPPSFKTTSGTKSSALNGTKLTFKQIKEMSSNHEDAELIALHRAIKQRNESFLLAVPPSHPSYFLQQKLCSFVAKNADESTESMDEECLKRLVETDGLYAS